jgi:hypothetical protein
LTGGVGIDTGSAEPISAPAGAITLGVPAALVGTVMTLVAVPSLPFES